ncbi:MAG: Ig-like domain-containing protein, partial [Planctomycetaceae bacterium]
VATTAPALPVQVDTFTVPSIGKFKVNVDLMAMGGVQTFEVISSVSAVDAATQLSDLMVADSVMTAAGMTVFRNGAELQVQGPNAFFFTTTVLDQLATIDTIEVIVTDVNTPPTLGTQQPGLDTGTEDVDYEVTLAQLKLRFPVVDDSAVVNLRIETVTQGTLKIARSNGAGGFLTAVDVVPGTTILTADDKLIWTPLADQNGAQAAFTIVAHDGEFVSTPARQVTVDLNAVNDPPVLTQVATFTGATEDIDFDITYADLLAKAEDEFDADAGDVIAFRNELIDSGLLRKLSTLPVDESVGGDARVDSVTIPGAGTFRITLNGNSRYQVDGSGDVAIATALANAINAESGTTNVMAVQTPGTGVLTLTMLPAGGAVLDTEFHRLTPMAPGVDTLNPGETMSWLAAANATGSLQAFRIRAIDNALAVSTNAIQVNVIVDAVNDAPTLTDIGLLTGATEDTPFEITYAALLGLANGFDVEGDALQFRIEEFVEGSLQKDNQNIVLGSTLLGNGQTLTWTPALNTSGVREAFKVRVFDGTLNSELPTVLVQINVTPINDAPEITSIGLLQSVRPGEILTIHHSTLRTAAVGLFDAELQLDAISFRIVNDVTGSALYAGNPPSFDILTGQSFTWTAPTGVKGATSAFNVRAFDGIAESLQLVLASVNVVDVPPVLAEPTGLDAFQPLTSAVEDTDYEITYADLVAAAGANLSEPNGEVISFLVTAVDSGTLTQNGVAVGVDATLTNTGFPLFWKSAGDDASSSATDFKPAF